MGRQPIWKTNLRKPRLKWTAALLLSVAMALWLRLAIQFFGLGPFLDWVVVAIPTIVGLAQWVIPMKQPLVKHRVGVFVACFLFSCLIYLQQYESRVAHSLEISKLATKDDIQKLPTADDIVNRFREVQTQEVERESVEPTLATASPASEGDGPATGEDIDRGVERIEQLIRGQRWSLTADQLLALSQRMAPLAPKLEELDGFITSVLGNPQSLQFATSLVAAFRAAGWKLKGTGLSQAIFSRDVQGIIVQVNSREDRPAGLYEFVALLRSAGIDPVGEVKSDIPVGQFRIIVGRRPDY